MLVAIAAPADNDRGPRYVQDALTSILYGQDTRLTAKFFDN